MELETITREVAETIQKEANIRAICGDPIKLDTHVVVPVATVSIGGGAGGGTATGPAKVKDVELKPGSGMGMGGGMAIQVRPVGFIHEKDGQVVFTRIEGAEGSMLSRMQVPPGIARIVGALRGHA
jgi:uncharacterized spore protein YtfJ